MSAITLTLSDEHLEQLKVMAREANVAPEQIAKAGLEDWLRRPRIEFQAAAEHVLKKNAELYHHLATS